MAQSQAASRTRPATEHRPLSQRSPSGRATATERRRRARHYRLRRRDLAADLAVGMLVSVALFVAVAGLGVLALIDLVLVGGLVVLAINDRRLGWRPRDPLSPRRPRGDARFVRRAGRRSPRRAG